jgi:hypothetical protein
VNVDLHKIAIYADKDGVIRDTPQRTYFSVLDGIIGMEGPMTYDSTPDPRPTGVVVAGKNPVAVDIVGSRIMGFNHTVFNALTETRTVTDHKIGEYEPSNICVIGTDLNEFTFNTLYAPHINFESDKIKPYEIRLSNFTAPAIKSVSTDPSELQAGSDNSIIVTPENIEEVAAGWIIYSTNGSTPVIQKLDAEQDTLSGNIGTLLKVSEVSYEICLQDHYLNLEWGNLETLEVQSIREEPPEEISGEENLVDRIPSFPISAVLVSIITLIIWTYFFNNSH